MRIVTNGRHPTFLAAGAGNLTVDTGTLFKVRTRIGRNFRLSSGTDTVLCNKQDPVMFAQSPKRINFCTTLKLITGQYNNIRLTVGPFPACMNLAQDGRTDIRPN